MTVATAQKRMDGLAWAMLVGVGVLWGGSFVLVEVILTELPVLTVVWLRVLLAAGALWVVALATGARPPASGAAWIALAVMGLCNNAIPFSLIVWAQTTITAGLAAILNATTPLFAGLMAGLLLRDERLTGTRLTGLVLGLAGVAVMMGPDAVSSLGSDVLAQFAMLGAALAYGSAAVFGRRFAAMAISPTAVAAGQTTMSSLILAPFALAIDGPSALVGVSAGVGLALLAYALLSTALAYVLYFAILARAGATNASLVTVLVPVVAVIVGAATLGETVSLAQVAGLALIALGLAVIDGRLWRRVVGPTAESAAAPPAPRA